MKDILALDATAQLHALEHKRISAFDLLEACQNQLNSRNVRLNAVVAADFERAQARARAIDDHRARGDSLGVLAGLPMTVKDSFDVDGLPASAGISTPRRRRASDANVVLRVKSQDAVVWGKSNVPALDRDWQTHGGIYGPANNPWDVTRTPGGSSGGSAAAVAAGLSALEIGSDSSGGLRLPAGFCGVFAHRPSEGLVVSRGHVPPEPGAAAERDMLMPGPVARSARDLRLLLSVLSEAPLPATAASSDLKVLKVGLWLDEPDFVLDPQVRQVIEAFAGRLAAEGAEIKSVRAPVELGGLLGLFADLLSMAEGADLDPKAYRAAKTSRPWARMAGLVGAGPWSWAGQVLGRTASHRAWMVADEARARLRQTVRAAFEGRHVIIAPCAGVTAFAHQKGGQPLIRSDGRKAPYASLAQWSALASVCGLPSTVVPVGLTAQGLPVGLQIIGPRGSDSRTLAVAQAFDETLGGFAPPPGA